MEALLLDPSQLRSTVQTIFRTTPRAAPSVFNTVLRSATADLAAAAYLIGVSRQLQREIAISTAIAVRTKTLQRCYVDSLPNCNGRGSMLYGDGRNPSDDRPGTIPGPDVSLTNIVERFMADTDKLQTVRFHLPSRGFYRVWLLVQEELIQSIEGHILNASFCRRPPGPRCVRTTTGEVMRCVERTRPPILRQR